MTRELVLDLFSGTAGASAAFLDRGYPIVTVDIDSRFNPHQRANITRWKWSGVSPLLIWASPPCTHPADENLTALIATRKIIKQTRPRYWVIETGSHASLVFTGVLGMSPRLRCGPFSLWGEFPPFDPPKIPARYKSIRTGAEARERLPDLKEFDTKGWMRAARDHIPYALSAALADAIERETKLLGTELMRFSAKNGTSFRT